MRVPSALGVSTVISPLPDDVAVLIGDAHVMRKAELVTADGETAAGVAPLAAAPAATVEPVVPAAPLDPAAAVPEAVPDALAVLVLPAPFPLAAAVEPVVAPSPEPPPPHAANASTTEYIE
jgi:hypothetical protein